MSRPYASGLHFGWRNTGSIKIGSDRDILDRVFWQIVGRASVGLGAGLVAGAGAALAETVLFFVTSTAPSGDVAPILLSNLILWTAVGSVLGLVLDARAPEGLLAAIAIFTFQRGGFALFPAHRDGSGYSGLWPWPHIALVLLSIVAFDRLAERAWVNRGRGLPPRLLASSFSIQSSASLAVLYHVRPPVAEDSFLLWSTVLLMLAGLLLSSRLSGLGVDTRFWALAGAGACCVASVAGGSPEPPPLRRPWPATAPRPARSGPNILLVVMDTMRRDGLGIYGNPLPTSPNIDRWASTAMVFENAYASSPYTHSSHASLFTGKLPTQHGALPARKAEAQKWKGKMDFGLRDTPLRDSEETLAEELRDRGYRTGAFAGNSAYLAPWTGLDQGFETFDAPLARRLFFVPWFMSPALRMPPHVATNRWYRAARTAERTTDSTLRWLSEDTNRPFFAFVNYLEVHHPYQPAQPFDLGFTPALTWSNYFRCNLRWTACAGGLEFLRAQYDANVAVVDVEVGRLLDFLREKSLANHTIVVVTSDHGELLGEHDLFGHPHRQLFEEGIRIPLIVKPPGQIEPVHVGERTALHRVRAMIETLLEPEGSVVAAIQSARVEPGILAESGTSGRAIFEENFKLIQSITGAPDLLFDLATDPGEKQDLLRADPDRAAGVRNRLIRMIPSTAPKQERRAAPTKDEIERLRALGYLR